MLLYTLIKNGMLYIPVTIGKYYFIQVALGILPQCVHQADICSKKISKFNHNADTVKASCC